MEIPAGFRAEQRIIRVLACPKCGAERDDHFPAWCVPPPGRRIMCEGCQNIWSPAYPEPILKKDA